MGCPGLVDHGCPAMFHGVSWCQALNSDSRGTRHWAAFTVNYAARSGTAFSPFAAQAAERLKGRLQGDSNPAEFLGLAYHWKMDMPYG